MQVTVNGRPRAIAGGATIATLLTELKVDATQVAVERNEEVVPRRTYAEVVLADGDRVEIVTFVGGG
jgi:thiamine biosynthesis protein ThiS